MTPENLFSLANGVAVAAWIVLAAAPRRIRAARALVGAAVPALFACAYIVVIAGSWSNAEGGFSSLQDVASLFGNRWLLLAGWIHYLAFDLLVGNWEAQDAYERRIPRGFIMPCLFLTFMFGPAGWLSYLGVRAIAARVQPAITAATAERAPSA